MIVFSILYIGSYHSTTSTIYVDVAVATSTSLVIVVQSIIILPQKGDSKPPPHTHTFKA